ncbi:probable membrane-associated kinase regulator 4 [Prosopis cineraria]|uniref:probable membrane-associated kinase regulator 4 n=1 Tax=Prosopis cineraria TaxID=364024 RepID=UPI00240EB48C|nr:probable membrane-associated kinase regulator 4 [Prosopis cineraria]
MEINSCFSNSEFEFQMSSSSSTSPADELFYEGKLLPLLHPPPHRLQMLQQQQHHHHHLPLPLITFSDSSISNNQTQSIHYYNYQKDHDAFHESVCATPCNVSSPSHHDMVNPEEEEREQDCVRVAEKNQMQKKKKKKKQQYMSLGSKLRAWFGKASCKCELAYVTKKVADEGSASSSKASNNLSDDNYYKQNGKAGKKLYPFGQIIHRSESHRFESFSSRIEFSNRIRSSSSSSSVANQICFNGSSSFSGLPSKSYGLCQELETGNLIMGAIAYCKQSHQQY